MTSGTAINKTMEMADLESRQAQEIIARLNELALRLQREGLRASSWYGQFELRGRDAILERTNRGYGYRPIPTAVNDRDFPWFLYWEIVWIVMNAGFSPGQRVLDLGGSSSLFSYYLASQGLEVTTVDLQESLVSNANQVALRTGWNLSNYARDMRTMAFNQQFDHITSICVYEHIPMFARVEINKHIKRLLVTGGRFSITFDYRNPSRFAHISTPEDVIAQFVDPSGLHIRGNERLYDTGTSYLLHPFYDPKTDWRFTLSSIIKGHFSPLEILRTKTVNDYTFAALFQEKRT